ncbi:oxygen-regulated protein 1-like [Micropterus salmoides]|uniref:oxygen-regulated protein 1-like n=1 Tax=Micropterus salmoides TaxID=27706 RepID=UPI0018EBA9F0|nr:oxygen-regulated protein 1-like [Micropterus salmoides]
MNEMGIRRVAHDQSTGSGHTFGTPRHPSIIDPILSKRVCFYKSGDPQFNGLRMVINNRTFKTFDALLDSLSKKVPLPFGVRNITTPRGVHAIYTLDELEDGKSYICSDSRKVKPINLMLARKKLPPWYHTRPASSRRQTVQQARFFPGRNIHKKEAVFVRTPRRLLVFRNGDPTVKHSVALHKRTTPTFASILEYISELIQFHVVKLHTSDGRRVDGFPGLILCSGIVVAAGKEPFKPANYHAQISPAPTKLLTNRMGLRRLKALNRKKKSRSYTSKTRNFSPSSERYIVNRIHNSIAEGSCDLPSDHTNSAELESGRVLESVAETEGDICLGDGAGGQDCTLPTEDDIEKSFRVNQDGSMTVEMRVRLTVKEEETIHWTTTLTRSSLANQCNASHLSESVAEQEIVSLKSNSLDLQSPAISIDTINKDKTKDNNDEDPPSLGNGVFSESSNEEDNIKAQMDVVSPRRAPTPGHKQIRKKQASMESINSVTADGIQEGMVGSYSYIEQTEDGAMTEQYCMVKQSSARPVPKPRRLCSVDANNINVRNVSTFKSAGMTEILQIESGEEVTETVLHIYEQQTCHDNFLANLCAQDMSASGVPFCRPATSDTGHLSSNNDFEPELWRPSTASESISIWRAESISVTYEYVEKWLEKANLNPTTYPDEESKTLETEAVTLVQTENGRCGESENKNGLMIVAKESNSLPDFSSHVVSTFGSSSKALLAFLSVMTLKEGITNINMEELNANNVSCAEALKMIDSLREIASIEDSHELKVSLSDLQRSASKQLLQSWKGFQELSDKCKSRSSTRNDSQQELVTEVSPEKDCGIDENVIDEIMDNLDIPEKLKDELASLSMGVKSDSDDKEKMSARISEDAKISHFSIEGAANVKDVTQDEKANADLSSIIKKFTDINQPEQPSMGSITETAKDKTTDQATKEEDSQYGQNSAAKFRPAEPNDEQIPEERQLYSTVLSVNENAEVMKACMEVENQENQGEKKQQHGHNEDESNQEKANMNGVISSTTNLEQDNCTSEVEKQDMKGNKLQMHSQGNMSILDKELPHDAESGSEQEEQDTSSANKDLEQKVSIEQSVSSSEADEQLRSEEESEVECKEIQHGSRESDDLSNPESHSEEEEDKQPSSNNDIELNVRETERISSPYSQNKSLSEEEQPEAGCKELSNKDALSNPASPSNSEEELQSQGSCMRLNASVDECTYISDVDEPFSEEEQPEAECNRLKVIIGESLSGSEEEQGTMEDEKHLDNLPDHREQTCKALIEETEEDKSALSAQSAPQSSLSFSYDSSGVITSEPEGNRVRYIREMFLAKSGTDVKPGQRCFPSPNTSELSKLRAETSASGGYQSQTSSELSSGEDDSARKSITKGFVRRTIERLYGKKDANPDEEANERPPSAPKQKKKEHSSIFSPFHIAGSKAMSELSYFSSTNALDTLSEATRCVAFNAQVGPEESVRWLLRENTLIRKSVSDPVGINKTFTSSPQGGAKCEDAEENASSPPFSTKSDLEDNKSLSRKCTYFSLPHASDSDACQDDLSIVSKSGESITDPKDNSGDTKMGADRNGSLPVVGITDFKMKDNKVHPLTEPPPDGEAVVVQPGKGQGVMNRRIQEPDMLDLLYNFCGQNCPIL